MPPNVRRSGLEALLRASAFTSGAVLGWRGPAAAAAILPSLVALVLGTASVPPRSPRAVVRLLRPLVGAGLLLPLLSGLSIGRLHRVGDPVSILLKTWRRHGYVAGVTAVGMRARILDRADLPEGRVSLVLRMERYRIPGPVPFEGSPPRETRVRLTLPVPGDGRTLDWVEGDCLMVTARVEPPRNFRNPGAFDYAGALRAQGIGLVGTLKDDRLAEIVTGGGAPWMRILPGMRRALVARLRRASGPGREVAATFLAALLVGERDDLPSEIEEPLIAAGVYHIVALSGLNVALIASLASFLLACSPLGPVSRRVGTGSAVLLYWLVARDSGSLTRATLMAGLYITGGIMERRVSALGSVAVTAMLLVAARPAWTGDAGFQLTFGATVGLVLLSRRGAAPQGGRRSVLRVLAHRALVSIRISAAALAGTALITACHFQRMTPIALLANLYAVPLADSLLLLALGIVLCDPVLPGFSHSLALLSSSTIDLLTWLSRRVSSPPGLSFYVVPPAPWIVVWASTAMALSGIGDHRKRRIARLFLATVLAFTVLRGSDRSPPGGLDVTGFDVGQGDAILVRLPDGFTILIDAGGFGWSGFDVGDRVVAPALRAMGLLHIDMLAVTHAHRDHLGGAAAILKEFTPGALWLGRMPEQDGGVRALIRAADARGVAVVLPRRGVSLAVAGARIEVLNPGPGVLPGARPANDDSLVLRISHRGRAALLTGDLEAPIEGVLVAEGWPLSADLLKIGHHGSRTSTTEAFLARVDPSLAVISVGRSNPWGHPDGEVLARLQRRNVRLYRTDRDGAVRFRAIRGRPWTVEELVPEPGEGVGR